MEPPHAGPLVPILRLDQVLGDRVPSPPGTRLCPIPLPRTCRTTCSVSGCTRAKAAPCSWVPRRWRRTTSASPCRRPSFSRPSSGWSRKSSAMPDTPRSFVCRFASAGETWASCCWPTSGAAIREAAVGLLGLVAQRLAPTFGRLARQWNSAHGSEAFQPERVAALLDLVAQVSTGAATPQRLAQALSHALDPLIPHDRFELLFDDPPGAGTTGSASTPAAPRGPIPRCCSSASRST